jgi:putative transposase
MDSSETIPKWFHPSIANQLFLPEEPDLQDTNINKHVRIQNYIHPRLNHLDVWFIDPEEDSSTGSKNYSKIIQTLQEKIGATTDPVLLKKLTASLKSNQTKLKKQNEHAGQILKCFTIGIPFSKEQHSILQSWYRECIQVYNQALEMSSQDSTCQNLTFIQLREKVFGQLYEDQEKPAPYEMLGDEVRSFVSNRKSCLTGMKRKVITHFTQKPRSLKDNSSIMIPGRAIVSSGIYKTRLGSIPNWKKIHKQIQKVCGQDVLCDSRLIYDAVRKRYTLNIPYYSNRSIQQNKKTIVALDPGEKIFMTYYSPEQSGYIGNNIRIQILEEERKIRRLERILVHKKNKQNQKLRNPKAIKRRIQIKYNRIRNIVSELHHQTAKYLTDRYERIYIPSFETQKMVRNPVRNAKQTKASKRKSRLNKRVKFVLNSLSHYRFRQHLQNKCLEKGCKMEIVDESYTSMTCGGCGRQSKKYENRRKECSCGCEIDRDLNGARNILLRGLYGN